jgi:hypothetical protein
MSFFAKLFGRSQPTTTSADEKAKAEAQARLAAQQRPSKVTPLPEFDFKSKTVGLLWEAFVASDGKVRYLRTQSSCRLNTGHVIDIFADFLTIYS